MAVRRKGLYPINIYRNKLEAIGRVKFEPSPLYRSEEPPQEEVDEFCRAQVRAGARVVNRGSGVIEYSGPGVAGPIPKGFTILTP